MAENIKEMTEERRAERAKVYRRRRILVGAGVVALCVAVGVGVNAMETAQAAEALQTALTAAETRQAERQQDAALAVRENRTVAETNLTA